jgi:hypothetical protein
MLQVLVDISLKFCCKKRHETIIQKREKRKKKYKEKRKMRIKIAHVLTKLFQVPIKRERYMSRSIVELG